jgi:hypothetical protein
MFYIVRNVQSILLARIAALTLNNHIFHVEQRANSPLPCASQQKLLKYCKSE